MLLLISVVSIHNYTFIKTNKIRFKQNIFIHRPYSERKKGKIFLGSLEPENTILSWKV